MRGSFTTGEDGDGPALAAEAGGRIALKDSLPFSEKILKKFFRT
jgi:hypothetical protein